MPQTVKDRITTWWDRGQEQLWVLHRHSYWMSTLSDEEPRQQLAAYLTEVLEMEPLDAGQVLVGQHPTIEAVEHAGYGPPDEEWKPAG